MRDRQVTPDALHGMAGSTVAKPLPRFRMVLTLRVDAGEERSRCPVIVQEQLGSLSLVVFLGAAVRLGNRVSERKFWLEGRRIVSEWMRAGLPLSAIDRPGVATYGLLCPLQPHTAFQIAGLHLQRYQQSRDYCTHRPAADPSAPCAV